MAFFLSGIAFVSAGLAVVVVRLFDFLGMYIVSHTVETKIISTFDYPVRINNGSNNSESRDEKPEPNIGRP